MKKIIAFSFILSLFVTVTKAQQVIPCYTNEMMQNQIDKDPTLQRLKADVDKLNSKYKPEIDKLRDEKPEMFKMFQSWGMIPKDYN